MYVLLSSLANGWGNSVINTCLDRQACNFIVSQILQLKDFSSCIHENNSFVTMLDPKDKKI